MTEDQIKHMVNRFLNWRLPENFRPDAGISFKATFNEHTAHPMRHEPVGTNLFGADQAEAMVRHMIESMPEVPDWHRALIAGFPWSERPNADPDECLARCRAAEAADLLCLVDTEPGSNEREEYGETMYRLTKAGRVALAAS